MNRVAARTSPDYDNIVFYILTATVSVLGEFEQLVVLAIVQLQGKAYGVSIADEIERRTRRQISRAAVYVTLRRLERKGLVTTWMGEPTAERGGKAKMQVKMRPAGVKALRESRRTLDAMWRGLDPALEGPA